MLNALGPPRLITSVRPIDMISHPCVGVGLLLLAIGLVGGCAGSKRGDHAAPPLSELSARAAAPPPPLLTEPPSTKSSAQVQNEVAHLSAGDTVLVSVEMQTPPGVAGSEPLSQQIAVDGTIRIWGGQQVAVAGLRSDEAASQIRLALITNYIGIVFQKVNVAKVQPNAPPTAAPPHR